MLKKITGKDAFSNIMSSLVAILVGLLIGSIIIVISNPSQSIYGISTMLFGGFSDLRNVGQVLYFATPIIMTGLSVGFANKTGLFNIGGPGQLIVGAFVAVFIGIKLDLPEGLLWTHWPLCIIGAAVSGALWGSIPGILKAYLKVNEVITCIMTNYIGMYLVNYLVATTIYDSSRNQSLNVRASAVSPRLGLNEFFADGLSKSSVNSGILVAIVLGLVMYVILSKTKFGFELKACGYNPDASKYSGINDKRNIITSMMIAGALCGIGGALLFLAGSGKNIEVVDILAAEGFNGIPVALLGLNNPIGIIFSGLFIAYLGVGGSNMQLYGYVPQVIEIITSVIIYFSAFALLVKDFLKNRTNKKNKSSQNANEETQKVNNEEIPKVNAETKGGKE